MDKSTRKPAEKLWIVVADEGQARILERPNQRADLQDVEQLSDPAARADRADLRRDAYGRRAGSDLRSGGNVTSSASDDELHREALQFARIVAERLLKGLRDGEYQKLLIAAAPRFLGYLRKVLPAEVTGTVQTEIDKDFVNLGRRELTQRLFPAAA